MKFLIAPFTAKVPPNKSNPSGICAKQFQYFANIVGILRYLKHETLQIGTTGEPDIGCNAFAQNLSLEQIKQLLNEVDAWVSVDSFLQHLAHIQNKPGIVIWSVSDPKIFGYPENLNIYKSSKYFRKQQHAKWIDAPYNAESWLDYIQIVDQIINFANNK